MNEKILSDLKLKINKNKKNFIAIHGPQGSGKTTLSKFIEKRLSENGYNVIKMSLDDFYYDYDKMKKILKEYNHELYKYRGLAGTHDLDSLYYCLEKLKNGEEVYIPEFNKSLHNGFGDIDSYSYIKGDHNVIILEGWMLGYEPLENVNKNLELFNNKLKEYQKIKEYFDNWIFIESDDIDNIYYWRLQAESKKGMNKQVFEDFMKPYYEVYKNYKIISDKKYIINKKRQILN